MARVTVEDCVMRVPNRFDLVLVAAQRARSIGAGATLTVDRDNDKNPVIALREIADGTVDLRELENNLVRGLQKTADFDEPEGEDMDLLSIQTDILAEQGEPEPNEEVESGDLQIEEEDIAEDFEQP